MGTSFTIEVWVKTSGAGTPEAIILKPFTTTHISPFFDWALFRHNTTTRLSVWVRAGDHQLSNDSVLTAGVWKHVVATYDGLNIRFFVNATAVETPAETQSVTNTNSRPVRIGTNGGNTEYFNGTLDEIRVSNSVRTAGWITTEFNNQGTPTTFYAVGAAENVPVAPPPEPTPVVTLTVNSTSPSDGATDVAIDTTVSATFSMLMNGSTLTTDTFKLSGGGNEVDGSVTTNGTTATFTPSSNLSDSTTYTAQITTGVRDSAGNAMTSPYTWSFATTVGGADITPPTVNSTIPVNGAAEVDVSSTIIATFSETMDTSTITTDTFTVSDGSGNIGGTVSYNGATATFTPSENLDLNTIYKARITTGAMDLTGNAMAADYTWSFMTISALPTPTITPTSTATATPTPTATPVILTGNIAGRVMDVVTGDGINGAEISMAGQTVATTGTVNSITGVYVIEDMPVGEYTLTASATGYETLSQDVTVESGETTTANFALEPVTTPTVTPTSTPVSCDVATSIASSSSTVTVAKGNSTTVTITVTGANGCAVVDDTVKATSNNTSIATVSPSKLKTDASGQATFTITGNKKGSAKVTFKETSASLKTKVKVEVTK